MRSKHGLLRGLCVGVFIFSALLMGDTEEVIKKTFDVGKGGTLTIDSDMGSIDVEPVGSNKVVVEILFKSDDWSKSKLQKEIKKLDINMDKSGNDVNVTLEKENDSFWKSWNRKMNVKFIVQVPEAYNVDLMTSGGSISVGSIVGKANVKTSGGSLTFGEIDGPVVGRTSGGSITLQGCKGQVDVRTSGGSIKIGSVLGEVEAHTSGGSIQVDEVLNRIVAQTSGGSVRATLLEQPKDDCKLTTSGGSIKVWLAEDIHANLDAKTSGGHVRTDFPVTVQGELTGNSLQAEINGGGPEIYLRTSGGGISINRK